jgi:glycosyltransferase involved in cell wall biosynthesis
MTKPLVAVVTPTKNRRKLLCEAIDSVQAQTLQEWEHIVVDDGSDDGTADEVRRRARFDARLRYIERSGAASGANVCRNQAILAASADLIVFLDSDDVLERDCLERRINVMQRNLDLDFATFQTDVFTEMPGDLQRQYDPELVGDDLLRFLYFEVPWIITAPIWRKTSLLRLGMFDKNLPSWQDVDLHIRALAAKMRYLRFSEIDHHVRWKHDVNKTSVRQRRAPEHLQAAEQMLAKFEQVVRDGPGLTWTRQRALCSLYFYVAERWIDLGQLANSLHCWALVRDRKLATHVLHRTGAGILLLQSVSNQGKRLGRRLSHKWKGWMRMRTNPELIAAAPPESRRQA